MIFDSAVESVRANAQGYNCRSRSNLSPIYPAAMYAVIHMVTLYSIFALSSFEHTCMLERLPPIVHEALDRGRIMAITVKRFFHRKKSTGTTDTVCRDCVKIIAASQWESDLDSAEASHQCGSGISQSISVIFGQGQLPTTVHQS